MIEIAICDDDVTITGKMDGFFCDYAKKNGVRIETEVFWDGNTLLNEINNGKRYDIIFLDIEMKNENGIQAARKIRRVDKNAYIVYVTSYEQYMREAFSVRPFQFIVKPFEMSEVESFFDEAYQEILASDYYFRYRYERIEHKILVKDIIYFKSNKRKLYIHTVQGEYEMYGKLCDIEKIFLKGKITFMRIHQSFLVNYTYVVAIGYDYVTLYDGTRLSISEDRKKQISKQYCNIGDRINVSM